MTERTLAYASVRMKVVSPPVTPGRSTARPNNSTTELSKTAKIAAGKAINAPKRTFLRGARYDATNAAISGDNHKKVIATNENDFICNKRYQKA